jgi:hypothetical protein
MAHNLQIEIEDIFQDERYIRVVDWSQYDKMFEVTNRVFKVEPPESGDFKLVNLPTNDSFVYSSKSLKLCSQIEPLDDGIWIFTLSVCPNEKRFTKVYHFRTVKLENRLMSYMSKVLGGCLSSEVNDTLIQCLLKIKGLKGAMLDEFNMHKAYTLYNEVWKTINSLKIQ